MQTQNTDQDPIATKASKRNVKCEIGKRTARVGKGETKRGRKRGKNRAKGKGTKAMGFLQRRLLHQV